MVWNSVSEFFQMGGYGLYVWGSVVVVFGFMAVEQVILSMRKRTIREYLRKVSRFESEEMNHEG